MLRSTDTEYTSAVAEGHKGADTVPAEGTAAPPSFIALQTKPYPIGCSSKDSDVLLEPLFATTVETSMLF